MTYAVRVEGLGKRYSINQGRASVTLRETITRGIGSFFGSGSARATSRDGSAAAEKAGQHADHFWALKDVSFDVAEGERIGVIGANGAGKSTLLKILSQVTAPTEGSVEIRGKVASLLEVGTGFHPELSGRENIFLNGAIIGMTNAEIRRNFDQIVEFSGVEKFIDTPVKYYSSGMYVRLAFSVSAWLEPDILIVDEVLAVGDMAFQKKCIERMRELTREGRTILFVSHNMTSINQMCQKALVLNRGHVVSFAPVEDAIIKYRTSAGELAGDSSAPLDQAHIEKLMVRGGTGEVRIRSWRLKGATGHSVPDVPVGGTLECEVEYEPAQSDAVGAALDVGFAIDTIAGTRVCTYVSGWQGHHSVVENLGGATKIAIRDLLLRPGTYLISLSLIHAGVTCESLTHCGAFNIVGPAETGGISWQADFGSVRFPISFSDGAEA